jgi:hypothetical protein
MKYEGQDKAYMVRAWQGDGVKPPETRQMRRKAMRDIHKPDIYPYSPYRDEEDRQLARAIRKDERKVAQMQAGLAKLELRAAEELYR